MKIRMGMVSNSSSGSFLFPKGMTVEDVEQALFLIEEFLINIGNPPVSMGLSEPRVFEKEDGEQRYWTTEQTLKEQYKLDPEDFYGCVIVDTLSDNSVPYDVRTILEETTKADYIHYG
jgi:hypothetical protein